jgi:predicted dehydrogenase
VKIDPRPIAALAGTPAYNVAKLYQQLARSIKGDRSEYPTFVDAVRTHHLLDASERAALSGARQEIARN